MAIVAADIIQRFSVKTGTAGDSTVGTAAGSLGKYVSTTAWTGGTLHDLFDKITGDENAASTVDYRCIFILNNHATLTAEVVRVWLASEVAGGASVALAIDDLAASAKGSASAQADEIANETTAPGAGVGAFSSPTTDGTGLVVGDLAPGQVRAIWIRRTVANTAAVDADGFGLGVGWDTAA